MEEVYRSCIGDNEANISTLQMLTNIENRLEELFVTIETMPADKVAEAEKAKEKERRMRLREEKLDQQRRNQEERLRRFVFCHFQVFGLDYESILMSIWTKMLT